MYALLVGDKAQGDYRAFNGRSLAGLDLDLLIIDRCEKAGETVRDLLGCRVGCSHPLSSAIQ